MLLFVTIFTSEVHLYSQQRMHAKFYKPQRDKLCYYKQSIVLFKCELNWVLWSQCKTYSIPI